MDLTNEPLTKRKRAESPTLQPLSHPKRADGLWFDDGSIVLQAGTTQFRVHRSVLSANSAVFRDMFSVPQAAKGDEVVEGCYVVRLSDSAEDWIYVLRAFYDFRNCYADSDPPSFAVVAAFLRLGTKYEIPQLRSEAVKRLSAEYPSYLDEWDDREHPQVRSQPGIHFCVIDLAQEASLTSILPAAFYCVCAEHSFADILDGVHDRMRDTTSILADENQKVCMRGWELLVKLQRSQTYDWLDTMPVEGCSNLEQCRIQRMTLFQRTFPGPPRCIALTPWNSRHEDGFCGRCSAVSQATHSLGRAVIWDMLPSLFNMPGWEELLKE